MEIQTTIREFPVRIKNLDISPETRIRVIIEEYDNQKEQKKKGRWAKVAGKLSEESPLRGHGEALRKTSQEFRDNFRFREPPNFTDE